MDKKEAEKTIKNLRSEIVKHNLLYHTKDAPEISDEAYDALVRELLELEGKFGKIAKESPSQKVGGKILEGFEKVRHSVPQWSYDNIFGFDELTGWEEKVKRFIEKEGVQNEKLEYIVELKIDGLKVVLTYQDGGFAQGATRGDGEVGELVLSMAARAEEVDQAATQAWEFVDGNGADRIAAVVVAL